MEAIYKERLLKLAAFLRTVPPEKFDLAAFIGGTGGSIFGGKSCYTQEGPGCGTTACAIGWCPVAFPDECKLGDENDFHEIVFTGEDSLDAPGMTFFGVDSTDWDHLFFPVEYDEFGDWTVISRTPTEEADVIEAFVAAQS